MIRLNTSSAKLVKLSVHSCATAMHLPNSRSIYLHCFLEENHFVSRFSSLTLLLLASCTEDITCPRVDTNFIFECSTRYLTSERSSLVRYRVEHDFSNFPKISEHFPKIFQNSPNSVRSSYEHFRSFPEIFERCSKISEDCRMFPSNRRGCFDHIEMNLGSFDN